MEHSRRQFIGLTAMGLCRLPFMVFENQNTDRSDTVAPIPKIYLFSKHLQFLKAKEMAESAAVMGFDGLDLTLRKGGHIDPDKGIGELSDMVKMIQEHRIEAKLMTTDILDVDDLVQFKLLHTASQLGFTHYRMGWFRYNGKYKISQQLKTFRDALGSLDKVNKQLDLKGCYQNHSGNYIGSPIWDIHPYMEEIGSANIGYQYDIRHAMVEGGQNWEITFRMISPFIQSIVLKDFIWGKSKGVWKPINVPIGMGMVNFGHYFSLLKKFGINVPMIMHFEYDLGGAQHGSQKISMDRKEIFSQMKRDLDYVRNTWQKA